MSGIKNTARGIVTTNNRILLMERWKDGKHYFSIPGGKIEPGEEPEKTVEREILEETGVKVSVGKLVAELRVEDSRHYIFQCEYISGEPALQEDSEEAKTNSEENSFNPGWQPVSSLEDLYLRYWEPLKPLIVDGLKNGFPEEPFIVEV